MAAYSTIDALSTLCTSVPDWNKRLDELDGQIALRQIELARLEEERPTAPRSIRNKGSTESLRPKDCNENNLPPEEANNLESRPAIESPKPIQDGSAARRPGSSAAVRAAAVVTPPPSNNNSIPKASPGAALTRQSSQPTPPTHRRGAPPALRKRKTESLASGESVAPKYRTRSMIIVYYDSAVQTAFEELVKFVSGSRNAIRKGKMAAKMAEMRRAAELEVEADEEAEDDVLTGSETLLAAQKRIVVGKAGESRIPVASELDNGPDFTVPKLRYLSTRDMGPSRSFARTGQMGSALSGGILRGRRRAGDASTADIFDQLDKGLEWCQSQCEHAAHQFLREGMCSQEIENIKKKLDEVKETAEKEVERLKKEAAETSPKQVSKAIFEQGKSRELRSVQMRKELGTMKDLEVDDMEVDEDEGVDDMEPPKLIFKRSRDVGA